MHRSPVQEAVQTWRRAKGRNSSSNEHPPIGGILGTSKYRYRTQRQSSAFGRLGGTVGCFLDGIAAACTMQLGNSAAVR